MYSISVYCRPVKLFILFLLAAYRVYNYLIFAVTSVGEGPSANGSFLTREDSELTTTLLVCTFYYNIFNCMNISTLNMFSVNPLIFLYVYQLLCLTSILSIYMYVQFICNLHVANSIISMCEEIIKIFLRLSNL